MRSFLHWVPLILLTAFSGLTYGLQLAGGASAVLQLLTANAVTWGLMMWVDVDSRRRRRVPCHDFAFLVWLFLPISLVWYLLWTRGWRGLITLVVLGAFLVFPAVFAVFMWALVNLARA